MRRLYADLLAVTARARAETILHKLGKGDRASPLAEAWYRCEDDAVEEVGEVLAEIGNIRVTLMAYALWDCLAGVEGIDRLIVSAWARRHAVLREVDRHRLAFANALRRAAEFEDAEFKTLTPQAASQ